MDALQFGPDWHEVFVLDDGTECVLRLIRPDDKDKIAAGLAKLSPKSQYLRFFTTKVRFTEPELRYLTEVDGHDHFAIAAGRRLPDGSEGDGVAIGRFVRLPDEPDVAEPAIAVVDELQGHGLGGHLLELLVAAARERGVKRFRSEFLASNSSMKALMTQISPQASFATEGPIIVSEMPIGEALGDLVPLGKQPQPVFDWLRLVAGRAVTLRRRFAMLFDAITIRGWLTRLRQELGLGAEPDEHADDD